MVHKLLQTNRKFGICLPFKCDNSQPRGFRIPDLATLITITNYTSIPDCDMLETEYGDLPRYMIEVKGLHKIRIVNAELCMIPEFFIYKR
jgi:Lon protease-like protein